MPDVKGPVASNGAVVPAAATAHPNSKKALQKLEVEEQIEADKNEELNHLRDQAWGRYPKLFIWLGISLMWTIFELDNATVYNCPSSFLDLYLRSLMMRHRPKLCHL